MSQVLVFGTEEAMLTAWLSWVREADPDIINIFQASASTLHTLQVETWTLSCFCMMVCWMLSRWYISHGCVLMGCTSFVERS